MKDNISKDSSIYSNLINHINLSMCETADKSIIDYDELPQYDLFLSQVTDYMNDKFEYDKFTNSIIQNYVKNEVISKPEDGKKRGYTKLHIVQLILVGYMRPILSTDEIKSIFKLAFNDINNREDDILSWEDTYKLFGELQHKNMEGNIFHMNLEEDDIVKRFLSKYEFKPEEKEKIISFIMIINLVAHASNIKKLISKLIMDFGVKDKTE